MTNWKKMESCGNYHHPSMQKDIKARKKKAKRLLDETLQSYQTGLKERATPAEIAFQNKLTELSIKYEFQKIIKANKECYIVDFYLTDYHIICEIDGDYHNTKAQTKADKTRTRNLVKSLVVSKIVRFNNNLALAPGNHKTIMSRLFPETKNLALMNTEPRSTRSNLVELDKRTG